VDNSQIVDLGEWAEVLGELYGLYQQAFLPEKKFALEMCGGNYQGLLALSGNSAAAALKNKHTIEQFPCARRGKLPPGNL
jgi:hypothetical protein